MTSSPPIGFDKAELDTPALCLDLDVMDANVRAMAATCARHGVAWRPHAKCHKSSWIGRRLIDAGAIGLTCAKLGEAEVMADAGVRDLLIANMIVGPRKLARLATLTQTADPIVCVDDIGQAQAISDAMHAQGTTVRVLVEVDIGLHRVGVAPGESTLRLARQVSQLPGTHFAGLMAYEGHLLTIENQQEKADAIARAIALAVESKQLLESHGIACEILSCGGTGSYLHTIGQPGITEVQAGGAIFMDAFYRHACQVPSLDYALTVVATVVSRPSTDRAVMDAGRKTLNGEIFMPRVLTPEGAAVTSLSAEHGSLTLHGSKDLRVGDRVELVPGYADLTVNLHDHFFAFRDQKLERIIPIEARGRLV